MFDEILSDMPADLRAYVETMREVKQRADKHPEIDVYSHLRAVTDRIAHLKDINLSVSAVCHDFGKDRTTRLDEKTGILMSPGHARYSAQCVGIWKDWVRSTGADPYVVAQIITYHMFPKEVDKWEKKVPSDILEYVRTFSTYDYGGTE